MPLWRYRYHGIMKCHHGTLVVEAVIPLVLHTRGITMLLPLVCRDETIYYRHPNFKFSKFLSISSEPVIITDGITIVIQLARLFVHVHAVSMETKGHVAQETGPNQ